MFDNLNGTGYWGKVVLLDVCMVRDDDIFQME